MSTQSASMTALLAHFDGVESTDTFLRNATLKDGSTFSAINMQLWTAFNNFEYAEEQYSSALADLQSNVERAQKYIVKGNTADSSWIVQYASKLKEANDTMAAAVKTILALKAIYKTL